MSSFSGNGLFYSYRSALGGNLRILKEVFGIYFQNLDPKFDNKLPQNIINSTKLKLLQTCI